MAVKPLEIHPEALAELKSALSWYLERNETAAVKFAAELDRAMDLLIAAHVRSMDATLVTNNLAHFQRVPGLKVTDLTRSVCPVS